MKPLSYVENVVVDVLVRYYKRLARWEGIRFEARLSAERELGIAARQIGNIVNYAYKKPPRSK